MQRRLSSQTTGPGLVPVKECILESNTGSVRCTLMNMMQLHFDNGVAEGYIRLSNPAQLNNILRGIGSSNKCFKNIDHVQHTYVTTNEESNMRLDIKGLILYNVIVNRYRDSDDLFYFMSRVDIQTLQNLKKLMEETDGTENLRSIEGRV